MAFHYCEKKTILTSMTKNEVFFRKIAISVG